MTTAYFAEDPQEVRLSVSAVVYRPESEREILLMKRSDNALWGLPGGYVEPGESVEVATERDLFNFGGTFYELPARNAQGFAKIRPIATHNLKIYFNE